MEGASEEDANLSEAAQHSPEYCEYPELDHPFELNIVMKNDASLDTFMGVVLEHPTDNKQPTDNKHRKTDMERKWLLDSGATSHYVKDVNPFRTYDWLDQPVKIYTGKGPVWGLARGEVEIVLAIGKVVVGGVLLVPDLDVDADLMSVTALMAKGFSVTFAEGKADIHKDGKIWGTASCSDSGGLLYVEEYECVHQSALAASCVDTQTLDNWHKRLAHIQQRVIKEMIPKVTGLRIGEPTKVGE